jgi:hypothetical protein
MEQAAIHAARHVFDSLTNAENDLFTDHMYGYLNATVHPLVQPHSLIRRDTR